MQKGAQVLGGALLLMTSACSHVPPQTGPAPAPPKESATSADDRPKDSGDIPGPPSAAPAPSLGVTSEGQSARGTSLCVSARPDLAQTVIALDLLQPERPEVMALLREWLLESWLGGNTAPVTQLSSEQCDGALLCAAVPPEFARPVSLALARALKAQPQGAFFQGRADLLTEMGEWDATLPRWRLHTAAYATWSAGPFLKQLLRTNPLPSGVEIEKLVSREAGAGFAKQVVVTQAQARLIEQLPEMRIRISGFPEPKALLGELLAQINPGTKEPSSVPRSPQPSTPPQPPVPSAWITFGESAGEMSHAALLWRVDQVEALPDLTTSLYVLAARYRSKAPDAARVRVALPQGLYRLPSLEVDGAHEQVLAAVEGLTDEAKHFAANLGGPTEEEWEAALSDWAREQAQRFPCGARPLTPEGAPTERARALFSDFDRQAVILWGAEAPISTEESSE